MKGENEGVDIDRCLDVVLEHAPVGLLVVDKSEKILLARGRGLRALGFKGRRLEGLSAAEAFGHLSWAMPQLQRALAGEGLLGGGRLDGLAVEVRYVPIRDERGNVRLVMVVATDVSAKVQTDRELRTSSDLLRVILERVSEGIVAFGPDGKLVFANPRAAKLAGYPSPEALLATTPREVLARFDFFDEEGTPVPWEEMPTVTALRERAPGRRLVRFRPKGTKEIRWCQVETTPVMDENGELRMVVEVCQDQTDIRRAQERLKYQRSLLAAQQESLLEGILFVPMGGAPVTFNVRFAQLWQLPEQARQWDYPRVSAHIADLLENPDVLRAHDALGAQDPLSEGHDEFQLKDGRTIECYVRPVMGEEGELIGRMCVDRDVTARKLADERQRSLFLAQVEQRRSSFLLEASRLLARSVTDSVVLTELAASIARFMGDWCILDVLDHDGEVHRLVAADPGKQRLARELEQMVQGADAARKLLDSVREGRARRVAGFSPKDAQWPFGPQGPMLTSLVERLGARTFLTVPLTLRGEVLGALTVVSARPERAFGSDEQRVAEVLARRIARAVENHRLYTEARQAVLARDEFLSVAAHELRTPIGSLWLTSQHLLRVARERQAPAWIPPKLELIERQCRRLNGLVDRLLDVTRLVSGTLELELEELDLVALVREELAHFRPDLERARCEVQLETLPAVVGRWDRARLSQVVSNLLSNALKYGEGRPVEVHVAAVGGLATLSVRDHGIGIAPELQKRIFSRFIRGVSGRRFAGLGLGLYIAHQVVEAHGGNIRVRSRPGEGAEFVVELPRERPGREREPFAPPAPA